MTRPRSLTPAWRPDHYYMIVNKFELVRDRRVIDVLKDNKFTVHVRSRARVTYRAGGLMLAK